MPQKYTEARKEGNRRWDAANLDRISIAVPKGEKAVIQAAATEDGKSVNQYIGSMVDERLEGYLRRKLKKYGYELHKSRGRKPVTLEEREQYNDSVHSDMGGYRITDKTGAWIEGRNFELSLVDVDSWVKYMGYD